ANEVRRPKMTPIRASARGQDCTLRFPGICNRNPERALQALGWLKVGQMSKTEAAYAATLAQRQHAGEVTRFKFEGLKFWLADNTSCTSDFAVMLADGALEAHEVKGHRQDDARAKIKLAADLYPLRFVAIPARPKKDGGGWATEEL
ncbi:MAG: DUF1364 family protein, partial [Oxalobacteraceae bacterium]